MDSGFLLLQRKKLLGKRKKNEAQLLCKRKASSKGAASNLIAVVQSEEMGSRETMQHIRGPSSERQASEYVSYGIQENAVGDGNEGIVISFKAVLGHDVKD